MFGSKERRINRELDALMKIVPSAYEIIENTLSLTKEDARLRALGLAVSIAVCGCASKLTDPNGTIKNCIFSTFQHVRSNRPAFANSKKSDQELHNYFYDFTNALMRRWDECLKYSGVGPDSKIDHHRLNELQLELMYLVEDGAIFSRDDQRDSELLVKSFELVTLISEARTYFAKLAQ